MNAVRDDATHPFTRPTREIVRRIQSRLQRSELLLDRSNQRLSDSLTLLLEKDLRRVETGPIRPLVLTDY